MRSTVRLGPRTPAIQKMHVQARTKKALADTCDWPVLGAGFISAERSIEADNFCRIDTGTKSHSRTSEEEAEPAQPERFPAGADSDLAEVTQFFQTLLARDEFDSVCPRTAGALSQLLAARHRLRVNCSSELAESGRFDPLLRQLLAHLQAPLCEALESGSEGCDR